MSPRNCDRSGGGYRDPAPHHNSSGLPRPPPIPFRPTSRLYARHCQLRLASFLHSHRITHGTCLHRRVATRDTGPAHPTAHDCQCGLIVIQIPSHVIIHCPRFRAARERILKATSPTLSPNILFGMRKGGEALTKFIEETRACVRPRRRLPEDHG
jgi:hypothetical protein